MATTQGIDPLVALNPSSSGAASSSGSASTTTSDASPLGSLNAQTFLQLLTTQLQYQDPLAPMDSTQFVTQLAQFSQLEDTTQMQSTLQTTSQYLASLNNYSAAGLIGHQVQVVGNQVSLTPGVQPTLAYGLSNNAAQVTVTITDASGNTVRVIQAGPQSAGTQDVTWDGNASNGSPLPAGTYSFGVSAVDSNGLPVTASAMAGGVVTGVSFNQGVAYLIVNGSPIPASNIIGISN